MNVFLKLDPDQIESIIRNELIEHYNFSCTEPELKKALRKVIRYYSTPKQWKEFKKDNA